MNNAMKKPKKRYRQQREVPILTSTIPDREKVEGEPHMVGYVRVSTADQSLQRQVDELVIAGVAAVDVFSDVGTGANMERDGWENCVKDLQSGDILVIHSIDRLSRDLVNTMSTLKALNDRGVRVKVLTLDFDSQVPIGRFVFSMMAAFAQFERDVIRERTIHGLAKARARGIMGGRKLTFTDEQIAAAVAEQPTFKAAAKKLGASEITIKRRMAAIRSKEKQQ